MPSKPDPEFLNVTQAAALLGRSRKTFYKWLNAGRLAGVKMKRVDDGNLLIDRASLLAWGRDEIGDSDPATTAPSAEAEQK